MQRATKNLLYFETGPDNAPTLHVEPGDEIWVPEEPYRDVWDIIQGTVQTLIQSMTIIVLVRAI